MRGPIFKNLVPAQGKPARLYQAVLELMNEGMDISAMKVSDITRKAGIGKGTAYEYFKSKEEIIAQAILTNLETFILELDRSMDEVNTFEEKYLAVLGCIEKNLKDWKSFLPFVRVHQRPCDISHELEKELFAHIPEEHFLICLIRKITDFGKIQGVISKDLPEDAANSAILAHVMTFVFYLQFPENRRETVGKMKEYSCRSLLNFLG